MRILSFDQSITSSAAVSFETDQKGRLRLKEKNLFAPKSSGIYRFNAINEWIIETLDRVNPHFLVREQHLLRQFGAAGALQSLSVLIDLQALKRGLLKNKCYAVVNPGVWKKFCLGKGNLRKDTAYMIHINKFIHDSLLIVTPNNFQVLDDNIGDAICIGVTGYTFKRIADGEPAGIVDPSKYVYLQDSMSSVFDYGKRS